jgi:hypothetical protein
VSIWVVVDVDCGDNVGNIGRLDDDACDCNWWFFGIVDHRSPGTFKADY